MLILANHGYGNKSGLERQERREENTGIYWNLLRGKGLGGLCKSVGENGLGNWNLLEWVLDSSILRGRMLSV